MDSYPDSPDFDDDHFGHMLPSSDKTFDTFSDEQDFFKSPDFIPQPDDGPDQRDEVVYDQYRPADAEEMSMPVASVWKAKHVHFLGRMMVDGDDAPPAVSKAVAEFRKAAADSSQLRAEALLTTPICTGDYPEEVANARLALTSDFGQEVGTRPIYIVDENVSSRIISLGDRGAVLDGALVVQRYSRVEELYGAKPVLLTLLEAGAMARVGDPQIVTAARDIGTLFNRHKGVKIDTEFLSVDSLHDITVDPKHGIVLRGFLFEQGFAASYAIRNASTHPHHCEIGGYSEFKSDQADRGMTMFTDEHNSPPRYNTQNDMLSVPWRYCYAINVEERQMQPQHSFFAAYGIDLLDEHLPGLYGQMMKAHETPGLKEHIRQRIDAVEPGLYARLSAVPNSKHGMREGVIMIIRALGIADEPIPPPSMV